MALVRDADAGIVPVCTCPQPRPHLRPSGTVICIECGLLMHQSPTEKPIRP